MSSHEDGGLLAFEASLPSRGVRFKWARNIEGEAWFRDDLNICETAAQKCQSGLICRYLNMSIYDRLVMDRLWGVYW